MEDWVVTLRLLALVRVAQDLSLVAVGTLAAVAVQRPPPLPVFMLLAVHDAFVAERGWLDEAQLETGRAALPGDLDQVCAGEWLAGHSCAERLSVHTRAGGARVVLPCLSLVAMDAVHRAPGWVDVCSWLRRAQGTAGPLGSVLEVGSALGLGANGGAARVTAFS